MSSSSSTSSTSTELCDDPASDCSSERSAKGSDDEACDDCDRNRTDDGAEDAGHTGEVEDRYCRARDVLEVRDEEDEDDVSLAEMLRANSEVLNRMCRGDGASVITSPGKTSVEDSGDRLPDLIDDFDVFVEPLVVDPRSSPPVDPESQRFTDSLADGSSSECSTGEPRSTPSRLSEAAEDNPDDNHYRPVSAKPFDPFPSKVRQPKRLGIELGLYPDGSN